MRAFHVATDEEIRSGRTADVYFWRGDAILDRYGANPVVRAEVRTSSLPRDWTWAVFAGLEEALALLDGRGVAVRAIPEGTIFRAEQPVLEVTGPYRTFGVLETALLGLLCQASGVATVAARCKQAAGERPVYSFGARRMHPAIAPMIERAAYLGGCDGVASVAGAELVGLGPVGTMAHALILILGEEHAFRGFDEVVERDVPRVALIDTFDDEKFGALRAAEILGERLRAVRVDTPRSRRGDFAAILEEVRWELDLRGHGHVRVFVSGGIDEGAIPSLNRYADAYGVGTAISNAPVVDFALDLVEVEGRPLAKRGKMSGGKQLWRCRECGVAAVLPLGLDPGPCVECGGERAPLLEAVMRDGARTAGPEPASAIRERVVAQYRWYPIAPG